MKRYCLLLCSLLCFAFVLHAQEGKWGHLKWSYAPATKTLTITGKGKMEDYPSVFLWWKTKKINSIIITEGVTSIGRCAFDGCSSLTSVVIPNSVKKIEYGAFDGCSSLTSVVIPNSVKSIGDYAFRGCRSLTSVVIPNSVKKIEYGAFDGCRSLISVVIPNTVKSIGGNAFQRVPNIVYSGVAKGAPWDARSQNGYVDGYLVYKDATKTTLLACSAAASGEIVIPNSVKSIGRNAFDGCSSLTSVVIPNSVKSIGDYAFNDCSNLASAVISNGVKSIGFGAFSWCCSLTSVVIPNSVTNIEKWAFNNVPNIVYSGVAKGAPWEARSQNGYVDGYLVYKDATKTTLLACSAAASGEIAIPNSVKSIGHWAFNGCSKLLSIYYPKTLKIDGTEANIPSSTKLIALETIKEPTPTAPRKPPLLALVEGSLEFADASQNNCIDADERNFIRFKIVNNGKGTAQACKVRATMQGNSSGISVEPVSLPTIPSGTTYEVALPLQSSINTQNGKVAFNLEVSEPNGWGIAPFEMIVATRAYDPPFVQVVDYAVSSTSGKIRKMEPFTLTFNLQNTQYGDASDVRVRINLPDNVLVMDGESELAFPRLASGEAKTIKLVLAANNNFALSELPVNIEVREKYGQFAQSKQLPLALNQTTTNSVTVTAKEEPQKERTDIRLATLGSDVDKNIPVAKIKSDKIFAVIIANENYQQVASVPYALNDGNIFRQYCEKTLGIPESNIRYVPDATGNNIRQQVNWLKQVIAAYKGEAKVIFYYAGHGVPDEKSKTAFLLPVDGNGSDPATGYKLDDLYKTLGASPARSVTVLLDACFSGSKREEGMLASARGVAVKVQNEQPIGNMVVFSAATGDETAYPNRKEGHGMFTYWLLKKLQETAGEVTYSELGDYIRRNVSQQSIVLNSKSQTPTVIPSSSAADWQLWKLK